MSSGGRLLIDKEATSHKVIYYPLEVSSMKYCCLGVFRKEYFRLVTILCK